MSRELNLKIEKFKNHLKDPLYKNSFYLLLTSVFNGLGGFIFWIIAAKLYPQEDVGISTAIISAMMLIAILSGLGFDQSLIRFFPEKDKNTIFSTTIIICTISSIIFSLIYLAGLEIWSPKLVIIREFIPLFLFITATFSISSIIGTTFIASRKSNYYFFQNLLFSSKIILLLPLLFLGFLGIFVAFGLPFAFSIVFIFLLPFKLNRKSLKINIGYIKESIHFSSGSYLTNLLLMTPSQIVSLMTLNVLGAKFTASYYISYSIASLLFMVPSAFSTSLFVEGSHDQPLRNKTIKTFLGIFALLTPLVIFFYFFGGIILEIFGKNYLDGLDLLKMFSLSSFFVAICSTYISIKKVQKDVKGLVIIGGLIFLLTVGLSYPLMLIFGLNGVGYAWFFGYGFCSILILFLIWKNKWI